MSFSSENSPPRETKRILLNIGFAVTFLGAGMMIHHFLFGYRYQVRESKDYETPFGPVRWSYVTESVGLPILDPGTTVIELDGRTIFKAKRGFQEASPFAKNLTINGDQIFWEDGDYAFTLSLRKLEPPSRAEINQ